MRGWLLAAIVAVVGATIGAPAVADRGLRLPPRPNTSAFLRAGPIAPNGTLIREAERLRTLELDEFAPLRLRLSTSF